MQIMIIFVCMLLLYIQISNAATVTFEMTVQDRVTDLYNLSAAAFVGISSTFYPPEYNFSVTENTRYSVLLECTYPAPLIDVLEGNDIDFTYENRLGEHPTLIHFHGIAQRKTPYYDGSPMVSQCPLSAGAKHRSIFKAEPYGTHMYHGHLVEQALEGLVGPLIVRPRNGEIYEDMYDDEQVIMLTDVYQSPNELHANFFTPLSYVAFNGIFGSGTKEAPYFQINVESGKCYRLRWIAGFFELCGVHIHIDQHEQNVIAVDGFDIEPTMRESIAMVPGQRLDSILCANQPSSNYLLDITAPVQYSFPALNESFQTMGKSFFAWIHYVDAPEPPYEEVYAPKDTGYTRFDTTWIPEDVHAPSSINNGNTVQSLPEATMVKSLDLGSLRHATTDTAPDPVDSTLIQYDFYFWDEPEYYPAPYQDAQTPILHTRGSCCLRNRTNIITINEEDTVLDIIINNRNDLVHSIHLHGPRFYLLGTGYSHNRSDNYPQSGGDISQAPCPDTVRRSDPSKKSDDRWGCPYVEEEDEWSLNKIDPPMMDTIGVPPYSWVYLRYVADTPGAWMMHCHSYDHSLRGMRTVINVLPDQQPDIPEDEPRCGPCEDYTPILDRYMWQCNEANNIEECYVLCDDQSIDDNDNCVNDYTLCKGLCDVLDESCIFNCAQYYAYCNSSAKNREDTCDRQCKVEFDY